MQFSELVFRLAWLGLNLLFYRKNGYLNIIKGQIMTGIKPSREEAFSLLKKYNKNDSLIKHALAVEAVMRYFARKFGQDEEEWGVIGLVHDLDYEQFPEQHCRKTEEILTSENWPADYIRAVVSHGWGI